MDSITLQTGDVLLQRAGGPIGWAIEAIAGRYSHALVAYNSWIIVDVTWPGGGRYQNIEEVGRADVYRYEAGLDPEQRLKAQVFLSRAAMTEYDLSQFFGYVPLPLLRALGLWEDNAWDSRDQYICSEVADRMYQHLGIDLLPEVNRGDATPHALSESDKLTFVREC